MFGDHQQGGRGGYGGGYMPIMSPWYFVGRMLGGAPQEKVDHNLITQILIPILRGLMGGAGICLIIIGYLAMSYVWHANVALDEIGRLALPLLVFGLPGVISAVIGIFNPSPETYWGSRQSMFLIFGIASGALAYTFGGIAIADPQGELFGEIAKTACFIGLSTLGFLLAIWGIVEQIIVYQMSESQKVGWSVIRGRLDEKIDMTGEGGDGEDIIREWRISFTVTPRRPDGTTGRPVGPKTLHFDPNLVPDDKFAYWAQMVLGGEDVGYPTWVASGRFSRRGYDHLTEVLSRQQYLAKRGSARNAKLFLTIPGKDAVRAWLEAYTQWEMNEDAWDGQIDLENDDFISKGEWDVEDRPTNST